MRRFELVAVIPVEGDRRELAALRELERHLRRDREGLPVDLRVVVVRFCDDRLRGTKVQSTEYGVNDMADEVAHVTAAKGRPVTPAPGVERWVVPAELGAAEPGVPIEALGNFVVVVDSGQQVGSLSPQGMVPGPVNVWVEVLVGQFSFQNIVDLGIVKESTAPSMTISDIGEFDGSMWRIGGQYSDPDGEPVDFTIEVDGQDIGQIVVSGNTWESEWIDLSAFSSSNTIEVVVTGCDNSGKCTTSSTNVNIALVMEELVVPEAPAGADAEGDSLPASGLPSLVIAISLAVIFRRRGL